MKRLFCLVTAVFILCSALFFGGCKDKDNEPGGDNIPADTLDPMVTEVTENFISIYWNAENNSFFTVNSGLPTGRPGPYLGILADFWWEAQNWETVMDIYERQGGDLYREMVDKVYDGFLAHYGDYKDNDFNDDIGWWAMGCTRAYALTGGERYLRDAKEMFDYIYAYKDDAAGGGIYWKNTGEKGKNVCVNAPAAITVARLYKHLNDPEYLEISLDLFDWLKTRLYDSETGRVKDTINAETGEIYDGQFSYNYGTFAGAAYELYLVTGEEGFLEYAQKAVDYYLSTRLVNGIAKSEGKGDGAAFRTIFFRTLNRLAKTVRPDYQQIINDNALATYQNRRDSDKLCGFDWASPPAEDESVTSPAAAAGVSLMQFYKK